MGDKKNSTPTLLIFNLSINYFYNDPYPFIEEFHNFAFSRRFLPARKSISLLKHFEYLVIFFKWSTIISIEEKFNARKIKGENEEKGERGEAATLFNAVWLYNVFYERPTQSQILRNLIFKLQANLILQNWVFCRKNWRLIKNCNMNWNWSRKNYRLKSITWLIWPSTKCVSRTCGNVADARRKSPCSQQRCVLRSRRDLRARPKSRPRRVQLWMAVHGRPA